MKSCKLKLRLEIEVLLYSTSSNYVLLKATVSALYVTGPLKANIQKKQPQLKLTSSTLNVIAVSFDIICDLNKRELKRAIHKVVALILSKEISF